MNMEGHLLCHFVKKKPSVKILANLDNYFAQLFHFEFLLMISKALKKSIKDLFRQIKKGTFIASEIFFSDKVKHDIKQYAT